MAEYIIDKYGDKVILELKWGQGAKDIGGEIQVTSLDYALFLKKRGYIVDPNPTDPKVQTAFKARAVTSFARHSRLGATDLDTAEQVRKSFIESVAYLRKIGFRRISLKTGSYGMEALAMAIRYSADAKLNLLTIDDPGVLGLQYRRDFQAGKASRIERPLGKAASIGYTIREIS